MSAISLSKLNNTVYGHIALGVSATLAALTATLFFNLNLTLLPTSLLATVSGTGFVLALALYHQDAVKAFSQFQSPLNNGLREDDASKMHTEEQLKNKVLFDDTKKICNEGKYVNSKGKTIEVNHKALCYSFVRFEALPPIARKKTNSFTHFSVRDADALDVALEPQHRIDSGMFSTPLVVCPIAAQNRGGGVEKGSSSLESAYCRRTNLYEGLQSGKHYYPLTDRGGLYLNHVSVFRDNRGCVLECSQKVAFIGAAPASNETKIKEQIRTILRKAYLSGHTHLIFGPFDRPSVAAPLFYQVFNEVEFKSRFSSVTFAIQISESDQKTFQAFKAYFP